MEGYGKYKCKGRVYRAHALAYESTGKLIPPGHILHHTCGVHSCVNPKHLEALKPGEHTKIHKGLRRQPQVKKILGI